MQPQVSVFLGISLDGFIAREDGGLDWLDMVQTDPPEDTGYDALMASVDTLVIGRRTYDTVLGFGEWPYPGKRVVVLTRRALEPQHGETAYAGPLPHLLGDLGTQGCRHVYLDGGEAVRQGLDAGLVSKLTLSWVPVILGSGRALFGPPLGESRWVCTGSRAFPSGLVQASYRRPD